MTEIVGTNGGGTNGTSHGKSTSKSYEDPDLIPRDEPTLEQRDARETILKRYIEDHFYTPTELRVGFPDPGFLIDELLPAQGVFLFVGESGAGKSWAAYDLVRAVITGTPWLGRTANPRGAPFSALIINYDNPASTVSTRLAQLGIGDSNRVLIHTVPPGRKPEARPYPKDFPSDFKLRGLGSRASEPSNVVQVVECISEVADLVGARLIIFDSLRQAQTGKEEDSEQMSEVMSAFKQLAYNTHGAVVVVHHTAKGSGSSWEGGARGSTEIVASSDVYVEIRKGGEYEWIKTRTWDAKDSQGHNTILKVKLTIDENDLVSLTATGHVPGVKPETNNLRTALTVLAAEKRWLGLEELRAAMKATKDAVAKLVEFGVSNAALVSKRESSRTQKVVVGLPGWGKYGPAGDPK